MGENIRILVVDDDSDTTLYLCSLLEDHGYEVETASDTESGWDALAAFDPHLVTLDVMMPGRSGLDLLVRLRSDPQWSSLPLVLITGNDAIIEDEGASYLRSHGVDRGPDAVQGKPIETTSFLATIASLTDPGRG